MIYIYIYIYIYIHRYTYIYIYNIYSNINISSRNNVREEGSAPRRGRHSAMCVFPPNASVRWQPDGLTIHTKKWLQGAGFLGAPPISLTQSTQLPQVGREGASRGRGTSSCQACLDRRHGHPPRFETSTSNPQVGLVSSSQVRV